jgi:predicted O-methyltransferase YrrM
MTASLNTPKIRSVLDRLFAAAARDGELVSAPIDFQNASAQELADALDGEYMPISAAAGDLLYTLVRSARPQTVVEFGTSFGISTLYLAAGVADNGAGHVYGSELSATKLAAAQANFEDAGLSGQVTLLGGDARESLADVAGPIDLVLLDGWKDLYLDVLRSLEPRLRPGALVVADDTTFPSVAPYLAYVRDPASGYVSVSFPVEDGMELSCRN